MENNSGQQDILYLCWSSHHFYKSYLHIKWAQLQHLAIQTAEEMWKMPIKPSLLTIFINVPCTAIKPQCGEWKGLSKRAVCHGVSWRERKLDLAPRFSTSRCQHKLSAILKERTSALPSPKVGRISRKAQIYTGLRCFSCYFMHFIRLWCMKFCTT